TALSRAYKTALSRAYKTALSRAYKTALSRAYKTALSRVYKTAFLLACVFSPVSSFAAEPSLPDKVYVRDTLYVPLRGGQSNEYRILHQGIRSGTSLERLEINKESGFSRVRLSDGKEGWMQSQYLVIEPIARDQLIVISEKHSQLESKYQQVLLRIQEQDELQDSSTAQIQDLDSENRQLREDLIEIKQLAADTIAINDMNQQLQAERDQLQQEIDDLATSVGEFKDSSDQDWFLRGAGTILLGLFIGFLASRGFYNSRRSEWS
ncbi:MAG TPA: TIGR04211 family SH3 domain-containing protein, partial [Pseudomonadales bacterium]|nr:TIGR04211 family SH3 domain-containing protein [Pseudomonadales bacterium]